MGGGLKDVQADVLDNKNLITKLFDETKKVTSVQRKEMSDLEQCVKNAEIRIGQHDERLKAYEGHVTRQNGSLDKLNDKIDKVSDGVDELGNKIDEMSLNVANRMNSMELASIERDKETEKGSIARNTATNLATKDDIGMLRKEFLKYQIRLNWRITSALAAVAFLFMVVIITILTHTFGGIPTI